AVLAMVFSLLITIGNAYLLPLLPLAVFIRVGRIGLRKAAAWSFLSLFLAIVVVAAVYQGGGAFLNPKMRLRELALRCKLDCAHIQASPAHFNFNHLRNVALQTMLFSIGGLRLPATMGGSPQGNLWAYAWAASDYLARLPGLLFCLGYLGLIIAVLAAVFKTRLWSREPVIKMMLFWGLLYVYFFVYFNPWAGPVYAMELQFSLWGLVGLALHHWRPRVVMLAPWLLLPVLALNNWSVLAFFRDFYGRLEKKEFLTADVFPTGRDSGLMIWEIKPEAMTSNTMRVEAAHALAGEKGGFWIVAYTDDDNDLIPDREIAKSDYLRATNSGEWSSYTFTTRAERVYVGIAWPPDGYHFIFRSAGNWPNQATPLEGRFYYSAPPNEPRAAGPGFTNLRLSFIDERSSVSL
ncbi:MAG: hypothetical protein NTV79_00940, partial [Candidatus Aureabacteria bacterium]|nr:hypothetical protein [Candidatus Auribacterota bacterium]